MQLLPRRPHEEREDLTPDPPAGQRLHVRHDAIFTTIVVKVTTIVASRALDEWSRKPLFIAAREFLRELGWSPAAEAQRTMVSMLDNPVRQSTDGSSAVTDHLVRLYSSAVRRSRVCLGSYTCRTPEPLDP
jgi:hypothetical protein